MQQLRANVTPVATPRTDSAGTAIGDVSNLIVRRFRPINSAMNIRWKVIALVAAVFLVLGVAEIFVADRVLRPSFAELEHSDAEVAMRRIDYALDPTLDHLALSATGWGNWTMPTGSWTTTTTPSWPRISRRSD